MNRIPSLLSQHAGRLVWIVATLVGTAAVVFVALNRIEPSSPQDVVAVLGALIAVAAAFLMPVHWIPALALVIYGVGASAFIPAALPLPVPPPVLLLFVWVLRRLLSVRGREGASGSEDRGTIGAVQIVSILLVVWMLISMYLAPLGGSGAAWVLSFVTAVVLPMLVSGARREAEALTRTWIALGAALGVYALIEAALGQNFLYWSLGRESSQHWSAYRAEGPFGHPLLFATFLVVAFALALGRWLEQGGRLTLWAGIISMAGVVVTLSRGALVAAVLAFLFAYFVATARRGVATGRRLLGLGVLAAVGVGVILVASPIVDRWTSDEALGSSVARDQVWDVAMASVADSLGLGTGPGTSSLAAAELGFSLPIENSLLQILVSLGVPGLLLFGLLIGLALRASLRNPGGLAAASALVAYVVSVSGYNAIDDRRSAHVILGLLLVIALNARSSAGSERVADLSSRRAT